MFEHAYRKFRENMEDLREAAYWVRWHLLRFAVSITLPIWIIPYHFWRRKNHESNES